MADGKANKEIASALNISERTVKTQSALVNFEAVQQAPPLTSGETLAIRGASIIALPTSAPRGIFRQSAGVGFPQ